MQAAVIEGPGRPAVLRERPPATCAAGEVLVEVTAAPITPLDLLCASGTSYFGRPQTPYVPGVQGVGRVGGHLVWFPTTAGMRPGDGSMAALAAVPQVDLVRLPAGLRPTLMAALGLSAVAAHLALGAGGLVPGEQVVVLGAGGVVGQVAVQLARAGGARRVLAAARSTAAQERAQQTGADAVVALDTDDLDELTRRFAEELDGPADLVVDPLFGAPAAAAAAVLGSGGRLVNLGSSAGETSPLSSATIRSKSLRVLGYTNNSLTPEQRRAAITFVAEQAATGRLTVAHETVPLADVTAAWQRQAAGAAGSRLVLVPA